MPKFRRFFAFSFAVLLFSSLWASAPRAEERALRIRVQSFNIFLGFLNDKFRAYGRYLRDQVERGAGPDIVFIQEGFNFGGIPALREEAKYYPYSMKANKRSVWDKGRMSSGLTILSRFPFVRDESGKAMLKSMRYSACRGTDCLAVKGAGYARVEIPGVPEAVGIFDTHLNASYSFQDNSAVRSLQVNELMEFMAAVHPFGQAPAIFGGDFNMSEGESGMQRLREYSQMELGENFCAPDPAQCPGFKKQAIDHFLYRNGSRVRVVPLSYRREFLTVPKDDLDPFPLSRKSGQVEPTLSDHPLLEMEFALQWDD